MQHRTLSLLLAATIAATAGAQTLLIPAAANNGDLPSSSGWPFDVASAMRILYIYDSSHFTSAGVTMPIAITRIRVRANGGAATWAGDTIASLTVDLSTAPLDYAAISATFDQNHGADRLQVYNAPLVIPPGSSVAGAPGPFAIDIPLASPFIYDPNAGDLTIDYVCSGSPNVNNTPTLDTSSTTGQALARRVYQLSYAGSPTGTVWSGESAHAIEFTYAIGQGFASSQSYGDGCYDRASSVYEVFTGATFDLGGSATATNSIQFLPSGTGGFLVLPGSGGFFQPASPDLLLGDDALSPPLALPFSFPFGTLTTNSVRMCSNGFLWLRPTETLTQLTPSSAQLLLQGPRIAPFWTDLNPAVLVNGVRVGSCHFDVDPVTGNVYFTWLTVAEFGAANTNNRNTFQIELRPGGAFELRWQATALSPSRAVLTGASFGLGAKDGGPYDLSAAPPFVTFGDASPLRLAASDRPRLGTTIQLVTSNATGASLGLCFLGVAQVPAPGISLGPLGAPGCAALVDVGQAVGNLIGTLPGTSLAVPLPLPNNPALAGLQLYSQSIWLDAVANALGALSSNGVALLLDVN